MRTEGTRCGRNDYKRTSGGARNAGGVKQRGGIAQEDLLETCVKDCSGVKSFLRPTHTYSSAEFSVCNGGRDWETVASMGNTEGLVFSKEVLQACLPALNLRCSRSQLRESYRLQRIW